MLPAVQTFNIGFGALLRLHHGARRHTAYYATEHKKSHLLGGIPYIPPMLLSLNAAKVLLLFDSTKFLCKKVCFFALFRVKAALFAPLWQCIAIAQATHCYRLFCNYLNMSKVALRYQSRNYSVSDGKDTAKYPNRQINSIILCRF